MNYLKRRLVIAGIQGLSVGAGAVIVAPSTNDAILVTLLFVIALRIRDWE